MKLFSLLAFLLLAGALFAQTAPEAPPAAPPSALPPAEPAAPPATPTSSSEQPSSPAPASPAESTASAEKENTAPFDSSPSSAPILPAPETGSLTGYVGEGLYKYNNAGTGGGNAEMDGVQEMDALDENDSGQRALSPPRLQPADTNYSCLISPPNFSIRLGSTQELNVTCLSDDAQTPCPQMDWESALGLLNATSNESANFTPSRIGSGSITASSADGGNYTCSAFATVEMGSITSISIFPQSAELSAGEHAQFYVNASDDYGNSLLTTDANWDVQGGAGEINASGFFSALAEGNATVLADYNNMSANTTVSVRRALQPAPQTSGSGSGGAGTSATGGAVGSAAGVSAKRTCAGNPIEATVSEWGSTLRGASVSLYLAEGAKRTLVSQATTDGNGAAELKTEKEGDYELVASKDGMRDGRISFYLPPCNPAGSALPAQQGASFSEGAGTSLVLEREFISSNFVRTFSVYKAIDKDGAASYYSDITTTYTNNAGQPMEGFEVAETIPASVFSDVRSLAFTSYPRFSPSAPSTFYWKAGKLAQGQKASFTYRMPRALTAEMIGSFAAPSIVLGGEKPLSAKIGAAKDTGVLATVAAFAGAKDVSALLELAGMTLLALATLFAAYTFFAGKKSP